MSERNSITVLVCIAVLFKTAFRNDFTSLVMHIRRQAMGHTLPSSNNLSNQLKPKNASLFIRKNL
jgi:hypothetical protein